MSSVHIARLPVLPVSDAPLRDRQARTVTYLRVSLTDRCNFRCTYCMPESGVDLVPRQDVLTLEEVLLLCRAFVRFGVRTIRLTGGEPTIRKGIVELVGELARLRTPDGMPVRITMTTNGHTLERFADPLARAGLSGITVSIDSLDRDRFRQITRRGDLARVVAGIDAAVDAGLHPLKLNTVAVAGFNDDELGALTRFAWERGATPRFIELMPMSGGALFVPGELMPAARIRDRIARDLDVQLVNDDGGEVRGAGPARYVRVTGGPHAGARIGTIGALTENFCADCNRLRVSATGALHACLAHDDASGLRTALRSRDPDALETVVRAVLGDKREGHAFEVGGGGGPQKAMVSIGG